MHRELTNAWKWTFQKGHEMFFIHYHSLHDFMGKIVREETNHWWYIISGKASQVCVCVYVCMLVFVERGERERLSFVQKGASGK